MNKLQLHLSTGATIPLRSATAKSGNVYHATLDPRTGKFTKFGVKVTGAVVNNALPAWIKLDDGEQIPVENDQTADGRPRVTATKAVTVNNEARILRFSLSQTNDGNFNIKGSVTRPGGSSGKRAASAL